MLSEAGTFWLEVRSFAGDSGSYNISASVPGADVVPADSSDIAGSTASTESLAINASVVGQIDSGTDSDWYQLTVAQNESITVSVLGSATDDGTLTDPVLILRDSTGSFVDQVTGAAGENVSLTVEAAGTYWIDVRSGAGVSGTYTMQTLSNNSEGDLDIPGNASTTRILEPGDIFVAGLGTPTDRDWFRVDVEAVDIFTISVSGSESGGGTLEDPDIVLRTAEGVFFDQAIGEVGEDISLQITQAGTYFIDMRSFTGATGSYTISVTNDQNSQSSLIDDNALS